MSSKKRATWTTEDLIGAMNPFERNQCQREVDKKSGIKERKLGPSVMLSKEQEIDLKQRIFRMAEAGVPITSSLLRRSCFRFCQNNQISMNKFSVEKKMAGIKWFKLFLKRHPDLAKRTIRALNFAKAQKLNKFIVTDYFTKLKTLLQDLNLMQRPERIYNMDENECRLTIHNKQLIVQRGAKRVRVTTDKNAENVTIVSCGNAIGNVIPPMILFKSFKMKPEFQSNLPSGSAVCITPNGSMNTETFVLWLRHLAKFKPQGPVLLIFDGASSHLDYSIIEEAEIHDIKLICLPINTTHELQPMNKCVFRAFEHYWDEEFLKYTEKLPNQVIKESFGSIFSVVWGKALTPINIMNGFRFTGIFPYDPSIISDIAFAPSTITVNPDHETLDQMHTEVDSTQDSEETISATPEDEIPRSVLTFHSYTQP